MKQEEQIGRLRKNTALKNRRLAPSGRQNRSWKGKVPAAWLHIHEKNRCIEAVGQGRSHIKIQEVRCVFSSFCHSRRNKTDLLYTKRRIKI